MSLTWKRGIFYGLSENAKPKLNCHSLAGSIYGRLSSIFCLNISIATDDNTNVLQLNSDFTKQNQSEL